MDLAEIVLPAGTKTVTVREIPGLLASAIHPDKPDSCPRRISYLTKFNSHKPVRGGTEPLTDDDRTVLNKIWRGLPAYRDGLTESEWEQYDVAFNNASEKPEWLPVPCWLNETRNTKMLQIDAKDQHTRELRAAMLRGELTPLNHALVPVPNALGEALMTACVTVDNLRSYASRFSVAVRLSDLPRPRPLPQQRHQEQEILRVIAKLGCSAKELPKTPPGKVGVKARVRESLGWSDGVFDKAWERLRKRREIKDAM